MIKHLFLIWGLLAALTAEPVLACTSAVVSGKVTPDGRPLLWKNRDTDYLRNHVAYIKGEKYNFIADVNSANFPALKEAWMGTNSVGFALMNTQSYNLVEVKDGEERGAANGRIIYRALEVCATVEDFCHFLDTISKPSLIEANFGVIDAQGAAAMFEVDYYKYTMYDANNPKDAPYGYIARTNFSFAGEANRGAGYVRYMEADRVLMRASATGGITPQGIFNDLSRSFRNGMLDIDLKNGKFNRPQGSGWFVDQDFIPRNSTSCSIVVQGVKPGEKAELTTMWTMLGYPPTGIAVDGVPVRRSGELLGMMHIVFFSPEDLSIIKEGPAGRRRFLDMELSQIDKGYMQQLVTVEAEVFRRTCLLLDSWRQQGSIDSQEMQKLYQDVEALVRKAYTPLMEQ